MSYWKQVGEAVGMALRTSFASLLPQSSRMTSRKCMIYATRSSPTGLQTRSQTRRILNPILKGVDKETSEKMTREPVRFNMVAFLVAGHETTSGTLSFPFHYLLKNTDKYPQPRIGRCPS
jgi:hypothetical protein